MSGPPRRSRRSAAGIVVAGLMVCGVAVGALWSVIAPPIHTVTALTRAGERVDGFMGRDADNMFVSAAMMVGLLSMLAVVSTVAVWQWRAHRGPALVTALWIGQVLAAAAATATGVALAHVRYGTPDRQGVPLSPEDRVHYFTEAPPVFLGHNGIQLALTLLLPAALAALGYALLTVATPRDDLGSWPPESHRPSTAPAQVGAEPSV